MKKVKVIGPNGHALEIHEDHWALPLAKAGEKGWKLAEPVEKPPEDRPRRKKR